jgi:hypothetical protein
MLPNSVLHKRNGHRELPGSGIASPGALVRLVHSAPGRSSDLSPDVLKFAVVIQSECSMTTWERQLGEDGSSAPSAVGRALERSREAFERGELADVRAALEALQAQADMAAGVIARLTDVVRASDSRLCRASGRHLVDMNDLLVQTLGLLGGQSPWMAAVSTRLDPKLPPVAGDPRELKEVLVILMVALTRANGADGHPAMIAVETSLKEGVLRGESIVRVSMTDDCSQTDQEDVAPLAIQRSPGTPINMDLHRAARIVKEHGGILSATTLSSGGIRFTLELPAV